MRASWREIGAIECGVYWAPGLLAKKRPARRGTPVLGFNTVKSDESQEACVSRRQTIHPAQRSEGKSVTTRPQWPVERTPAWCARCGAELRPGSSDFFYITITAVADPTPPEITAEELAQDARPQIEILLAELAQRTEEELLEQVYRRLTFSLCGTCYRPWIKSPWS
jgi:hypothetical protein